MNLSQLSEQMVRVLQLTSPPVSLAFVDQAPRGVLNRVPAYLRAVPSG